MPGREVTGCAGVSSLREGERDNMTRPDCLSRTIREPMSRLLVPSIRTLIIASLAVFAVAVWLAEPAFAGIAVSIPPNYPPNVNVGQMNVPVSVVLTNNSADDPGNPGVDTSRQVTIDTVFHTPACDNVDPTFQCPAGFREPGVFQVVGPAIGSGGFAGCAGTWTIGAPDALTGEVKFTPPGGDGSVILGAVNGPVAQSRCTVTFAVNVLAAPLVDADPNTPGLMTDQLARTTAHFTDDPTLAAAGTGSDTTTLIPPTPT